MKRLLTYIGVALAVVSCNLYGEIGEPLPVIESEGVDIECSEITDNTALIKLAPKGEALYYAYVVDPSDTPEALDSMALYQVKYKSVSQGSIKWSEEQPFTEIKLEDLQPNTTYQVYAVAGSPIGIPSKVCVKSFKTSDTGVPSVTSSQLADGMFVMNFNEPVKYDGKGEIIIKVYATNSVQFAYSGLQPDNSLVDGYFDIKKVSPDDITMLEPETWAFKMPEIPAGAKFALLIDGGAFLDLSDNPIEEVRSIVIPDPMNPGEIYYEGLTGSVQSIPFQLSLKEDVKVIESAGFEFSFVPENSSNEIVAMKDKSISVVYDLGGGLVSNASLKSGQDVNLSLVGEGLGLVITNNREPDGIAKMVMKLPEGLLEDQFGNKSAAMEVNSLYNPATSIMGTYNIVASDLNGQLNEAVMTVKLSEDFTKGPLAISLELPVAAQMTETEILFDSDIVTLFANYSVTDAALTVFTDTYAESQLAVYPARFRFTTLAMEIMEDGTPNIVMDPLTGAPKCGPDYVLTYSPSDNTLSNVNQIALVRLEVDMGTGYTFFGPALSYTGFNAEKSVPEGK